MVVISAIIAIGLALGKVRIGGISLGIAFVFFTGIIFGNLGFTINQTVLDYTETFGLAMFVYCLGLHVGPNFFSSLRHDGIKLNLWSIAVIVSGTLLAFLLVPVTGITLKDMVGVLCGATTNTPALGAATEALQHLGIPKGSVALATAVTYPLGVVGVIFAMMLLKKFFVSPKDLEIKRTSNDDNTFISEFEIANPAINGKKIREISQMTHLKFIISRIWRDGKVIVPMADTFLFKGDKLLVVTTKEDEMELGLLFGARISKDWNADTIDWNSIDANIESRVLVVTRQKLNGVRLGKLQLRKTYGVNVSRVIRGDIKLLATDNLRLEYGDRVTVVGSHDAVNNVEQFLGNSVKTLNEPNIGSIFLGIILGLALGTIPFSIPGMDSPVRLGTAGGPIIMGLIVGALGPKMHFISYTTRSASLMLRKLGLSLYLASLGLDAGKGFIETVIQPQGCWWLATGFVITVLPVFVVGLIILKSHKYDFGTICGILCGSMANPMALTYANDTAKGDTPSIGYASVYPLGMFLRVIIAQMIIMFLV